MIDEAVLSLTISFKKCLDTISTSQLPVKFICRSLRHAAYDKIAQGENGVDFALGAIIKFQQNFIH